MSAPLLEAVEVLRLQMNEAKAALCSAMDCPRTGMYRDMYALVADYALEGVFSIDIQSAPSSYLSARDGHWWSASLDTKAWEDAVVVVCSTHFQGAIELSSANRALEWNWLGEMSDGSLLVISRTETFTTTCSRVSTAGKVTHLWDSSQHGYWLGEWLLLAPGPRTFELAVPVNGGVMFMDALNGLVLRECVFVHPERVLSHFPINDDCVLCILHPLSERDAFVALVFSRLLQRVVCQWDFPFRHADWCLVVLPATETVKLVDWRDRAVISCDVATGRVLHSMAWPFQIIDSGLFVSTPTDRCVSYGFLTSADQTRLFALV